MCETLGVSSQGFYAWRGRPTSRQQLRRDTLLVEIRDAHAESKQRYGSPRIHAELVKGRAVKCSVNTVAKLMRQCGVRAKSAKKFRHTTDSNHSLPVADNILDRDFAAQAPNERWVADITYIPTREGWLYLAAVEDLYSRMVVGWSMADHLQSRLVVDALEMAICRRFPSELLAHSDRGSQYASDHYQRLLAKHGIECSMSEPGQCWDNAPMESFFASLKKELVHHEDYQTRTEAKASIFEYIETFYNPKRRHSSLGYLSPVEYEEARCRNAGELHSLPLQGNHLHNSSHEPCGQDARQRSDSSKPGRMPARESQARNR
jgi:putative transposase